MMGDGMAGADIIPVDMAVSLIITVAWSTAMERLVFTEKYYILRRYIDVYVFVHILSFLCGRGGRSGIISARPPVCFFWILLKKHSKVRPTWKR